MLITLERQRLIRRQSGVARRIELLIDPSTLPQLLPSPGQLVKITVQSYSYVRRLSGKISENGTFLAYPHLVRRRYKWRPQFRLLTSASSRSPHI
jgi:hypothetical protein